MRGIDHLVLAGRDLDAMRARYEAMGFTLTPKGRHPFGTANSLAQLDGSFLELLSVAAPKDIPEHGADRFSFAAFNRDFLARREGFSMLVLDGTDARADAAAFRAAGLRTYEPFDFSRRAKLPSGEEVTVGFSLAFVSLPGAAEAGFFTCRQHAPQHFWKPEYQHHANGARSILDVTMVADDPAACAAFLAAFSGAAAKTAGEGMRLDTGRGAIVVTTPGAFAREHGYLPPGEGPCFAAFTVGTAGGERRDIEAFGTCIRFRTVAT